MTQIRSRLLSALILALMVQTGLSQETETPKRLPTEETIRSYMAYRDSETADLGTCRFYSVADYDADEKFGNWLEHTLPQIANLGKIHYYAPKKLLVVYARPEGHAEVESFLKGMKKAMSPAKPKRAAKLKTPGVMQAKFQTPDIVEGVAPARVPQVSYPVPAQVAPPKHLFHFIIRYEGAGIIDDSVVKFIKAQQTKTSQESKEEKPAALSCVGSLIGGACATRCDPLVSDKPIPFGIPAPTSTPTLEVPQKMKPIAE